MQIIDVKKDVLRAKVQENRDRHRAIFDEAVVGYRQQAVGMLEQHIARIKKGKVVAVQVYLPVPEDHTRDYDRVLAMLDMAEGETMHVTEQEFSQYVMDDWAWKRQFLTSNSTYSATAATALESDATPE